MTLRRGMVQSCTHSAERARAQAPLREGGGCCSGMEVRGGGYEGGEQGVLRSKGVDHPQPTIKPSRHLVAPPSQSTLHRIKCTTVQTCPEGIVVVLAQKQARRDFHKTIRCAWGAGPRARLLAIEYNPNASPLGLVAFWSRAVPERDTAAWRTTVFHGSLPKKRKGH